MTGARNPVALITGGSRGLGFAIAATLGADGHDVGLIARSRAGLDQACASLEQDGIRCDARCADVTDVQQLTEAIDGLETALGVVDIVVHAAGTMIALGPSWEAGEEALRSDVDTSILGALTLVRRVVPGMVERRQGRIVFMSSGVAFRPSPFRAAYAAGNAALASLTESLAAEAASYGLSVFAIAPGFVWTELTQAMVATSWFSDLADAQVTAPERTGELVARIARGDVDVLSGRLLHALDDLDVMVARAAEIERDELYVPRLGRLDQPAR